MDFLPSRVSLWGRARQGRGRRFEQRSTQVGCTWKAGYNKAFVNPRSAIILYPRNSRDNQLDVFSLDHKKYWVYLTWKVGYNGAFVIQDDTHTLTGYWIHNWWWWDEEDDGDDDDDDDDGVPALHGRVRCARLMMKPVGKPTAPGPEIFFISLIYFIKRCDRVILIHI